MHTFAYIAHFKINVKFCLFHPDVSKSYLISIAQAMAGLTKFKEDIRSCNLSILLSSLNSFMDAKPNREDLEDCAETLIIRYGREGGIKFTRVHEIEVDPNLWLLKFFHVVNLEASDMDKLTGVHRLVSRIDRHFQMMMVMDTKCLV
jgi:hypothetical protein